MMLDKFYTKATNYIKWMNGWKWKKRMHGAKLEFIGTRPSLLMLSNELTGFLNKWFIRLGTCMQLQLKPKHTAWVLNL